MKFVDKYINYIYKIAPDGQMYQNIRRYIIEHEKQDSQDIMRQALLKMGYSERDINKNLIRRADETVDIFQDLGNPFNWIVGIIIAVIIVLDSKMQTFLKQEIIEHDMPDYVYLYIYAIIFSVFFFAGRKFYKKYKTKFKPRTAFIGVPVILFLMWLFAILLWSIFI